MKTASINIRMEPSIKHEAEILFEGLGITLADAFNIFVRQALMYRGLPFEVRYPTHIDDAIREAELESESGDYKQYGSSGEMFADILAGTDDV
jgi:DNA-damage-inducible protein J